MNLRSESVKINFFKRFQMDISLQETFNVESNSFQTKSNFPGNANADLDIDALIMRVIEDDDYVAFQFLFNKMYAQLCHFCVKFVRSEAITHH